MARIVSCFAKSFSFFALFLCAAPIVPRQAETDSFELRGVVINAVTGEPVSWALVQLNAPQVQMQLCGTDGTFVFPNLPRGQYFLVAEKPGFFSDQQLGRWNARMNSMQQVPSEGEVVLKLTPEGIIYGQVKNEDGGPIEGVIVRAQRWQVEDGWRRLQNAGDAATDDQGNFRIPELTPGSYQLSFLPVNRGGWTMSYKLSRKKEIDEGYAAQFYPGVTDSASATVIQLSAGAQVQIDQTLKRQKLFEVSGVVPGINLASGFNLTLTNPAGDMMQRTVHIDQNSGEFQIPGIPAGTYLLSAVAQAQNQFGTAVSGPPLKATRLIHLNSDLTGLVVTLGPLNSLAVQVRDEIPPDETNNWHRVTVRLIPREFMQNVPSTVAPAIVDGQPSTATIDDIPPGTYTVEATTNFQGYIASLRCGSVDLLRGDLMFAQAAALRPIEVTLRNDGARLSVTVVEKGQPAAAQVVIYSEDYPSRSLLAQTNDSGRFSLANLAPGQYQIIAVKDARELEFRNPDAMEKYLDYAIPVTLQSGAETSVQVEVQDLQGQQP